MRFNHTKFRKAVRGEITQAELAAKLGIKQDAVSRILKRGNQMKIEQFENICEAINRKPTQFFVEGEPMVNSNKAGKFMTAQLKQSVRRHSRKKLRKMAESNDPIIRAAAKKELSRRIRDTKEVKHR